MPSPSLRDFVRRLEEEGELFRVTRAVSPILQITEVADRQARRPARPSHAAEAFDPARAASGGRTVLFENVEGCDFPLVINTFGSYRRMELALGCADDPRGFGAIADRIGALTKPEPPASLRELTALAGRFIPVLLRAPPRRKRSGICQEVVKRSDRGEVDLTRLPLIKCWPHDGDPVAVGDVLTPEASGTAGGQGRYITFAGMHTIHADDLGAQRPASHNIGMYRAQLIDETHLAMHWHVHHDGAAHWRSWKKRGEPMPIAICFGGESVMTYGATAPLPPGLSELLMCGFLNGRGIPLVRAKTVPLWVPANSEIVIEGYVSTECGPIGFDPSRDGGAGGLGPGAVFEGPFGDHTGFYSLPDRYPIVEVTAVTHREDPIFPATVVGLPPQEDYFLGKATERIFLPLLQTLIHDIDDYHLPLFGCFHNCAFVRIKKAYPLQARRVMHAIWGAGQMAWTKMIVVVDEDVDVHDEAAVLRAMFEHCHFQRDVEVVNGPLDILDHAAPRLGAGHKIGFDATRPMRGEEVQGIPVDADVSSPDLDTIRAALAAPAEGVAVVVPEFGGGRCVFVGVEKTEAGAGAKVIEAVWEAVGRGADFVVAVDDTVDLEDQDVVLFHLCANADPGRDLLRNGARVGIDATSKVRGDARNGQPVRAFPPVLEMEESVRAWAREHAQELGLGEEPRSA